MNFKPVIWDFAWNPLFWQKINIRIRYILRVKTKVRWFFYLQALPWHQDEEMHYKCFSLLFLSCSINDITSEAIGIRMASWCGLQLWNLNTKVTKSNVNFNMFITYFLCCVCQHGWYIFVIKISLETTKNLSWYF